MAVYYVTLIYYYVILFVVVRNWRVRCKKDVPLFLSAYVKILMTSGLSMLDMGKYGIYTEAFWKRPLGRLRRRLNVNIKMNLNETGFEDGMWMNLAQDRVHLQALVLC
jgi:hypothetical protein